jgi:hypothetical protein
MRSSDKISEKRDIGRSDHIAATGHTHVLPSLSCMDSHPSIWSRGVLQLRTKAPQITVIFLFLFAVLTVIKWIINECAWNDVDRAPPCRTSEEARGKGLLVQICQSVSRCDDNNVGPVVFEECWLERAGVLRYHVAWVPYYETGRACHVCFRLRSGNELFEIGGPWSFVIIGSRGTKHAAVSTFNGSERLYWFNVNVGEIPTQIMLIRDGQSAPVCVFQLE